MKVIKEIYKTDDHYIRIKIGWCYHGIVDRTALHIEIVNMLDEKEGITIDGRILFKRVTYSGILTFGPTVITTEFLAEFEDEYTEKLNMFHEQVPDIPNLLNILPYQKVRAIWEKQILERRK